QTAVVQVEPGFRVLHVQAGPRAPVPKHALAGLVDPFIDASMRRMLDRDPVDVLHANYWLSGAVAHRLKHELDLPMVATFHTLARVKAEAGLDDDSEHRTRVEHEVVASADRAAQTEQRSRPGCTRSPRSSESRVRSTG